MMRRHGMALLEVIIAMGIFTVVVTAVLQCLTGVRGFVSQETAQNDLVLEGRRLVDVMVQDVSGSAWYIPPVSVGGPNEVTTGGFASATQTELQIPTRDRAIKYYPYIMVQTPAGLGAAFPAFARPPAQVVDPIMMPTELPAAHRLPSQEVIFVKIAVSPPAMAPAEIATETIAFGQESPQLTAVAAATWEDPPRLKRAYDLRNDPANRIDATTWSLGIVTDAADAEVVDLSVQWETWPGAPAEATGLREYSYTVLPNAATGRAQLVRLYRNASDNAGAPLPLLDRVLSTNVDRLVVNTYRTDATLGIHQVRITLYLSRALEDGRLLTDVVEATAAMRSVFDAMRPADAQLRVGEAGQFTAPVVSP